MAIRDDFIAGEVLAAQDLNDTFASKLNIAGGKILQIVRATDSTNRSTTSTSLVDASISVTITPQKNDSAILLIWSAIVDHEGTTDFGGIAITDNSNNLVSPGTAFMGSTTTSKLQTTLTVFGYSTPATINATTYKGRFRVFTNGTTQIFNANLNGQMYAFEVSA